jgi:hypothetical protein
VSMMLLAIVAAAGVGLLVNDSGRRQMVLAVTIAAALTALYFLRPMSMT